MLEMTSQRFPAPARRAPTSKLPLEVLATLIGVAKKPGKDIGFLEVSEVVFLLRPAAALLRSRPTVALREKSLS